MSVIRKSYPLCYERHRFFFAGGGKISLNKFVEQSLDYSNELHDYETHLARKKKRE